MLIKWQSLRRFLLFLCVSLSSCSKDAPPAKGQLMLAISTDMEVPKDFDSIHVEVLIFGNTQFSDDYKVGKGNLTLPATLGIVAGNDPSQPVTIRVMSSKNGKVRSLREIITTVPSDRLATLSVPVEWLCLDEVSSNGAGQVSSTCDAGETCVAGACVASQVDSTVLPTYQAADIFGGGDGTGTGSCFDTVQCFASGQDAIVDMSACTIPSVAATKSGTGVSVALVRAPGSEGICGPDACLVPLDADSASGWTWNGDKIQLPKAVCSRLASGDVQAVAVTTACPSKTSELPTCGDWSSVNTNAGTFDAGAPQGTGKGGVTSTGGATSAPVANSGGAKTGGGTSIVGVGGAMVATGGAKTVTAASGGSGTMAAAGGAPMAATGGAKTGGSTSSVGVGGAPSG